MPSIRYPSLNEFWPAKRARNFVKALGFPPTKYVENMAILASAAGVHPAQMHKVNPLTFAERNGINVISMLGQQESFMLEMERDPQCKSGSATWAYALQQPIPSYFQHGMWAVEHERLGAFLKEFKEAIGDARRVEALRKMFVYIVTIEPFVRAHPEICAILLTEIPEIKKDPAALCISPAIVAAEAFLLSLQDS